MKTLILILALSLTATAQKVLVEQSDIDAAKKAFEEVVLLRAALDASQSASVAWKSAAEAQEAARKSSEKLVDVKDERIKELTAIKCNETRWLWGIKKTKTCF
jgi:hypothetical protein